MSMHLCGPGLTTTSYKKRKAKVTKAQQEEFERGWKERNIRLKQIGLPKETFEQYMEWIYGKGKKEKSKETSGKGITKAITTQTLNKGITAGGNITSQNKLGQEVKGNLDDKVSKGGISESRDIWSTGAAKTKQTPTYTGTKVIGIAVLHKSCLQPVFSQEEAIDVAHMRR